MVVFPPIDPISTASQLPAVSRASFVSGSPVASMDAPPSYVNEWYFPRTVSENATFKEAVASVSNSWQSITNEWPAIRDDFGRRVIFRSMIGFAGTNAFLGIMGQIVQDGATNAVSRKVVMDSALAPRTPLWMFVADNYAALPVSNLLIRIIGIYPEGDPFKAHFQSILSGEYKQWLDDARASGAIEY